MSDLPDKEQSTKILSALDEALSEGPWSETTFLNLIGKKLQTIRNEFADSLEDNDGHAIALDKIIQTKADKRAQLQKVFVSLYAIDGRSLAAWERILEHLPEQITSRPVYETEEDVIESMRSKTNRVNEAYAIVYIDPQCILNLDKDKIAVDKLGKPLLTLKNRAIQLDHIEELVHETGQYQYVHGRLKSK
jgi:intracellular multiplication protein IcmQ